MEAATQSRPTIPCYRVGSRMFTLRTSVPQIRRHVDHVFGAFRVDHPDWDEEPDEYRIERRQGSYRLIHGREVLTSGEEWKSLLDHLDWHITHRGLRSISEGVALHAAGVLIDGQAVLLVGPSGIGKSTLSLELVRRGCDFMSDEAIILGPDGRVRGFPRAIGLKAEVREGVVMLRPLPSRNVYLSAESLGAKVVSGWVRARAVVVLSRLEDETLIRTLSPAQALPYLCAQVLSTGPADSILARLTNLVSSTQVWSLNTGAVSRAADVLLDAAADGRLQ